MTNVDIAPTTLAFNGVAVRDKGEMLSLTDMWKAQGADDSRRPYEWSRKEGAAFVEAVSLSLNTPVERIYHATKGKGGATYAHWQIALAYAKYLSPEFHMWCNSVVRERMEGAVQHRANLPAEVLEMIRRDDGISRMLAHKVTEQGKALAVMTEQIGTIMAMVQPSIPGVVIRHGKTAGEILAAAGFTDLPKNLASWFGNRLEAAGCRVEGRGQNGLSFSRLFDPDRAEAYLKNGGKAAVEMKLSERRGQGALALAGRHVSVPIHEIESDLVADGRAALIMNGEVVIVDTTAYRFDKSESAVVINADGDMVIAEAESRPDTGRYWGEGREGQIDHNWMPKKKSLQNPLAKGGRSTCTVIGKVLERRVIRPRPVLAIDNVGAH